MISDQERKRLLINWPHRDSIACVAEVRLFDELSDWQCLLLAMNPDDEDEVYCLISGFHAEWSAWRLSEIMQRYNEHGEQVCKDMEYRPRRAYEIYNQLRRGKYET